MRVSRETFDKQRNAILDAAGRLSRGHGVDRVSLAEVSRCIADPLKSTAALLAARAVARATAYVPAL